MVRRRGIGDRWRGGVTRTPVQPTEQKADRGAPRATPVSSRKDYGLRDIGPEEIEAKLLSDLQAKRGLTLQQRVAERKKITSMDPTELFKKSQELSDRAEAARKAQFEREAKTKRKGGKADKGRRERGRGAKKTGTTAAPILKESGGVKSISDPETGVVYYEGSTGYKKRLAGGPLRVESQSLYDLAVETRKPTVKEIIESRAPVPVTPKKDLPIWFKPFKVGEKKPRAAPELEIKIMDWDGTPPMVGGTIRDYEANKGLLTAEEAYLKELFEPKKQLRAASIKAERRQALIEMEDPTLFLIGQELAELEKTGLYGRSIGKLARILPRRGQKQVLQIKKEYYPGGEIPATEAEWIRATEIVEKQRAGLEAIELFESTVFLLGMGAGAVGRVRGRRAEIDFLADIKGPTLDKIFAEKGVKRVTKRIEFERDPELRIPTEKEHIKTLKAWGKLKPKIEKDLFGRKRVEGASLTKTEQKSFIKWYEKELGTPYAKIKFVKYFRGEPDTVGKFRYMGVRDKPVIQLRTDLTTKKLIDFLEHETIHAERSTKLLSRSIKAAGTKEFKSIQKELKRLSTEKGKVKSEGLAEAGGVDIFTRLSRKYPELQELQLALKRSVLHETGKIEGTRFSYGGALKRELGLHEKAFNLEVDTFMRSVRTDIHIPSMKAKKRKKAELSETDIMVKNWDKDIDRMVASMKEDPLGKKGVPSSLIEMIDREIAAQPRPVKFKRKPPEEEILISGRELEGFEPFGFKMTTEGQVIVTEKPPKRLPGRPSPRRRTIAPLSLEDIIKKLRVDEPRLERYVTPAKKIKEEDVIWFMPLGKPYPKQKKTISEISESTGQQMSKLISRVEVTETGERAVTRRKKRGVSRTMQILQEPTLIEPDISDVISGQRQRQRGRQRIRGRVGLGLGALGVGGVLDVDMSDITNIQLPVPDQFQPQPQKQFQPPSEIEITVPDLTDITDIDVTDIDGPRPRKPRERPSVPPKIRPKVKYKPKYKGKKIKRKKRAGYEITHAELSGYL